MTHVSDPQLERDFQLFNALRGLSYVDPALNSKDEAVYAEYAAECKRTGKRITYVLATAEGMLKAPVEPTSFLAFLRVHQ